MKTAKKKILVIDDEVDFAEFLKLNLEHGGHYEVAIATDGASGIQTAKHLKPDLILQDIILPDMFGDKVLAELKKDAHTAKIPVFVLSALDSEAVRNIDSIRANSAMYLSKPIEAAELRVIINNFFGALSGGGPPGD